MTRTEKGKTDYRPLADGKLPLAFLKRLLKRYAATGEDVLVGPSVGVDAAALRFGKGILLAKTDPITFVAEDIGLYAVDINANDIAVMGGTPRWFLACILLPAGKATPAMAESIFRDLARACRRLKVGLCGGHTEITSGINRPIVIGQMLGEVPDGRLLTSAGARPGDSLILTKGIAVEAASILARERERELRKAFSARLVKSCQRMISRPGVSVLKDATIALRHGRIHAMHDPTEGGLATGVYELAMASHVGVVLEGDQVPVLPEFQKICDYFGIDPMGAIASGALLIAADPRDTQQVIRGLGKASIPAYRIGRVTAGRSGHRIRKGGKERILKPFLRDEIARVLEG